MFIKTNKIILNKFYKKVVLYQDEKGKYWVVKKIGKDYLLNKFKSKKICIT